MKLAKKIKKAIVVLLCISMVMTNILPSFADEITESDPTLEEIINNVPEKNEEPIIKEAGEEEITTDEEIGEVEEEHEELDEACEEEPEEDVEEVPEDVENIPEEVEEEPEEEKVSSPSEITDEPEEEEENEIPADMVEEPEEDEVIDEPEEEPMLSGSVASPSEVEEETEEENETEEEIEEATPSEIEEFPMLTMTPPLFGSTGTITSWEGLQMAIATSSPGDEYSLENNITVTSTYTIDGGKDITIDLNGHNIDGDGKQIFILKGKLKIQDSGTGGTITRGDAGTGNGGAVAIKGTGELTLESGTFTGNSAKNGGAISIDEDGGKFIMNGGNITGNTSYSNGAGIYTNVASTTIKMNGGEISGNIATNGGGGVYLNNAEMQLNGGKIINNTASAGAGICVSSNLNTKLYLGGNSVVKDNARSSGDIDNIYLVSLGVSTLYISTTTPLTSGAEFYVTVNISTAGGWGLGKDVGQYFNGTMTDSNHQYFYFTNCGSVEKNTVYSVKKSGSNYVTAAPPECKIGSTKYSTLEEAIAVANNQTITMLSDIILDDSRHITIGAGKTMTIDFNGYKVKKEITMSGGTPIFEIAGNGTIKDLKYYTDSSNDTENTLFGVAPTGTFTLDNMESLSTDNIKDQIVLNVGGSVTVIDGNITTELTNDEMYGMFVITDGGELTIKDNGSYTVNSVTAKPLISSGISYDGIDENVGNIIIDNGTFTGPKGISAFGKGNITINDGNFNTSEVFSIQANGIKTIITINNITANCNEGFLVEKASLQNKVDFQNGSVIYKPDWFSIIYIGGISPTPTPTQDVLIKKGKFGPSTGFTEDIYAELANLVELGAIIEPLITGNYKYEVTAASPECMIGSTEYATLADALTAAASGQTITILKDLTYENAAPNFIINGKNITIDFNGHSIKVNNVNMMITDPNGTKIFTVTNSGNLTALNGEIILSGMYASSITSFTVSGTNSVLTLKNMQQIENADRLVTNNGGKVYIDGGVFGYGASTNNVKLTITDGGTLNIKGGASFKFQTELIKMGESSNSNPDTDMGTVVIDSATLEQAGGDTNAIRLYGKANVTLNGGVWTGDGAHSSLLFVGNYGYKSNVTINNFHSDSPYVFISASNPNIESFTANVNNGHYKYNKGQFAIDRNNSLKPNIRLKGGFYGPDIPDTDAFNELNDLCISGHTIQTLTSSDAEYTNGYRYKVYSNTPSPTPTPVPPYNPGGGSSGGSSGGGGGGGSPRTDDKGNVLGPSGKQSYGYDGTNPPNLIGNTNISYWDYNVSDARTTDIHYVQNIDSFVRSDSSPVATEWVGVPMENISKFVWYRTNARGQILRNQFIQIGNNIYYLDNNGIMVTGQHTINGKVYNFETAVGATEGRFLY